MPFATVVLERCNWTETQFMKPEYDQQSVVDTDVAQMNEDRHAQVFCRGRIQYIRLVHDKMKSNPGYGKFEWTRWQLERSSC